MRYAALAVLLLTPVAATAQVAPHHQPRPGDTMLSQPYPGLEEELQAGQPGPASSEANLDPDTVRQVQTRLQDMGYYAGPLDGRLGPGTRQAISAWQAEQGLTQTGELSPALLAQLGAGAEAVTTLRPIVQPVPDQPPAYTPPARFRPSDVIGKTAYVIPGDEIGRIRDLVAGPDGTLRWAWVDLIKRYGEVVRTIAVPWSDVAGSVGLPVVKVPWGADKLRALVLAKDQPDEPGLAADERRVSTLKGKHTELTDGRRVEVSELWFDPTGQLVAATVDGGDEVPVEWQ
jgi:hypothetical protein